MSRHPGRIEWAMFEQGGLSLFSRLRCLYHVCFCARCRATLSAIRQDEKFLKTLQAEGKNDFRH